MTVTRLTQVLSCVALSGVISACAGRTSADRSAADSALHVDRLLAAPVLTVQASGTTALLQAVSAVNASVVWASGHDGTYVRTLDGGEAWVAARVPGADTLQFRDVHA